MIRLSRLADYGVVLMTHFTNSPGRLESSAEAAMATGIPEPTAGKVLKALARNGLLGSQRGINGGYALARPALEITIADIVAAVDGPIAITECLESDESGCSIDTAGCPTRGNWERINQAVRGALEQVTLADMALPCPIFVAPPACPADRHAAQ